MWTSSPVRGTIRPLVGTSIAHYRVTASLGAGSMGDVYRARDEKLGRDVALKVLPAEMAADEARLRRFRREARALAALDHPNIVTIFSIEEAGGAHFLTMELVEGRTLDAVMSGGRLSLGEFFDIARSITSAIGAAHARGITHRDIKPANVMVTSEGSVKVLDFGLARVEETAAADEVTRMSIEALSQEGVVVGTIPYMSPEQVEGKRLDHRTDIFSLGVLFYEMVTGSRPFRGATQPALMSSILRDVPPSVVDVRAEVPRHLGTILARCLEKSPDRRYPSAASLACELERLERKSPSADPSAFDESRETPGSGVAPLEERSIAVLPFVNRSTQPDERYFSDGLSEELINRLSKLPGVRVAARSSSFQFRGQEPDPREVGEKLGVDAVLDGSVRTAGARLRITIELVSCEDGLQLWSERYDGEMKDIFETQDDVVRWVVDRLEVELGSGDAARSCNPWPPASHYGGRGRNTTCARTTAARSWAARSGPGLRPAASPG